MIESSKYVADWRSWVRLKATEAMRAHQPISSGPIAADIMFRFPRPKSHYHKNCVLKENPDLFLSKKPDIDKLLRAVFDALTGIVFNDDSQIAICNAAKQFVCSQSETPITTIKIRQVT